MFTEIRTGKTAKGNPGEPIGDETLFGWAVHEKKGETYHNYFTRTTSDGYEGLYQLDVSGVEDRKEFDQGEVKKEFFENFSRKQTGRYVIKIPWIEDRIPQQTNEAQSMDSLFRRMNPSVKESYDAIIKGQLDIEIIEAPRQPTGSRIFYMPHKPVARDNATSMKVCMVFDASGHRLNEKLDHNKSNKYAKTSTIAVWRLVSSHL